MHFTISSLFLKIIIQQLVNSAYIKMNRYFILYFSILFISIFQLGIAQSNNNNSLPFDSLSTGKIKFIPYSKVYFSESNISVTFADSLIKCNKLGLAKQKASQGFSQNYYWVKFTIDWRKHDQKLILELDNPHVNKVELYKKTVENSFIKIGYGGDQNNSFNNRSYINRRYIFPLEKNIEPTEYFLMIDKRNSSVSFPLWLWNKTKFETSEFNSNIIYGIFFGVVFFLGILTFIIGILIHKKVFYFYSGYVLSMGLYLFTALGFSFQYIYPDTENFNNYSRVLLSVITAVFMTQFTRVFLNIDNNFPFISRFFKSINTILIFLTLLWIFFPKLYIKYAIGLLTLSNILFLSIFIGAFYAAIRGLRSNLNALIYFIAFNTMVIGVILFLCVQYGFINESVFPLNPILIGAGFEIVIFSMAMIIQLTRIASSREKLAEQNHNLKATKKELEQQKLQLEKEANEFINQISNSDDIRLLESKAIVLKSKVVLQLEDITHISSDSHYLEFYLSYKDTPEVDRNTIKAIMEQLPKNYFLQIHRSHIINTNYLKMIKASELTLKNGISLPLSRSFKPTVKEFMNIAK